MDKTKRGNESKFTTKNILSRTIVILLFLTLISFCLVSGLFAKYVSNGDSTGSAHVAAGGSLEIWEHTATLENGIYVIDETKKTINNLYSKVIPGVDIAKDPFIQLHLENTEVDYKLYLQVIKSDYFPETVTFALTDKWLPYDEAKGIYVYDGYFDAGTPFTDDIPILKNDTLYVSEHYVGRDDDGNDQKFSLSFQAFLKQVD